MTRGCGTSVGGSRVAKHRPAKAGREALVLVHLSSMDALAASDVADLDNRDLPEQLAASLGDSICHDVARHEGPVYVVDQAWSPDRRESYQRREVLKCLEKRPDARWILFDEDGGDAQADPALLRKFRYERIGGDRDGDWGKFLPALCRRLRRDGVQRAKVGGLWYTPGNKSGCASEVASYLTRQCLPAKIDESIAAEEGWVEAVEEERAEDRDENEEE